MGINTENLRAINLREKLEDVIIGLEIDKLKGRKRMMKINVNARNTHQSVLISEEFLENSDFKKRFISMAEQVIKREISIGSRHIYIGNKIG